MQKRLSEHAISYLKPISLGPLPGNPLVSVIMANYNYERYLRQSIESVLSQTYGHFELIVCDDGSTDNSDAVISRFARSDSRVKHIRKQNGGMASAWNAAHSESSGHIYCTLDADDTFVPDKLETIVRHFAHAPGSGFAVHPMTLIDATGQEIDVWPHDRKFEEGWIAENVIRRGGRWRAMITSAMCFRAELTRYVFPVPEEIFRPNADALVFTLAPLLTQVSAVDKALSCYRIHGANNFGTLVPDPDTDRKLMDLISRTVVGVNQRLSELRLDQQQLDLERNLRYLQARFRISLFEGKSRGDLCRMYASLARAMLGDDLYSSLFKATGLLVYGIAIPLPIRLRPLWWAKVKRGQYLAHRIRDKLRDILPLCGAVNTRIPASSRPVT
ncbi:glycosyl transferase family 2 [Pseudonocardia hierapolitana]|uniref:Glycosyl transferase family 2 n=1 Tax=Pseudonocardia hierapolitana TaxID=1128676 RepID=A0A561SVV7_9PSEU|nr:glycosyltransferase [Pseudonocardia hierapolitana]TWF78996.1 glycosyl transferase family 2 [Pseudonocardia hierapolitana]